MKIWSRGWFVLWLMGGCIAPSEDEFREERADSCGQAFTCPQGLMCQNGFCAPPKTEAACPPVCALSVVRLIAQNSKKCMDIPNSSTANGTAIQQRGCDDTDAQAFRLKTAGDGLFNLININSGKCVDIYNGNTADGATVDQWACNNLPAQAFAFKASGTGYSVINLKSAKCIGVANASTVDGAKIQQQSCNGGTHQIWDIQ